MKILHAGPLNVLYENGFLRMIRYGGNEIVRMIYFALRDHNWNTISHRIENERIETHSDRFQVAYDCLNVDEGAVIIAWKAKIEGRSDGSIIFEIAGEVNAPFRRNRAGFCVLHPLLTLGEECKITHSDGTATVKAFPADVAADNPFVDIERMQWTSSGISYTLAFEGDLFETEDQRNWGDASFKTFCTPLTRPFPVGLRKGDRIIQRITFAPDVQLSPLNEQDSDIIFRDAGHRSRLPVFGIAQSTESPHLTDKAASLLRNLRLQHYRIDLSPSSENFATEFSNAYENAFRAGVALEVALHLTDNVDEETEAFTVICQQNKVRLSKVVLLPANGLVTAQAAIDRIPQMKEIFQRVLFGAGTNYNFNEINKNRFIASDVDFITFSMDPQEHAFDNRTILENSASPEYLVRSAKSIYGSDMPVHISPLTLRKRFNPYATNPADLYIEEEAKADPRMKEPFAALWTLASVCSAAKGGASAITFFQTAGNQGILSLNDKPYPVYDLLKSLSPYQGKAVTVLESRDTMVTGILLDGKLLAMCNLSHDGKRVRWNEDVFELEPGQIRFEPLHRPK
ncbi:MAG: hypothetical protein M3Y60_03355 [Bacteroidota bacterium]|nr:hypothetical protein [Bacteroidota bacterium]